jgi:hypothetical protein
MALPLNEAPAKRGFHLAWPVTTRDQRDKRNSVIAGGT